MTFIAGFIYKDTIGIVADSAETIIFPAPIRNFPEAGNYQSSFVENIHIENNTLIYEGAQKLYQLENRIILTFAEMSDLGYKLWKI
jgi:hypothetical protein